MNSLSTHSLLTIRQKHNHTVSYPQIILSYNHQTSKLTNLTSRPSGKVNKIDVINEISLSIKK